ncbi:glycosyltransferase family 2 protein [Achromobacter sp. JUb104]|uniref:glycosyltransferase family 2 protein n=1 Tax=Achromobacter sp. JUb104 TaxID=2940590 RepID=UPI002168163C|nr:glycosyltransferase family 2 protein [Achromobacter sp. JUb104]MCS3507917.1 glycosyltransferase involved in cell wall biosynthesis [Achromobacter sp. JUb104]
MGAENKPLVSIVMPAFNAQRFIAEAIRSVLAQTYSNWELLVVDDSSTDDTAQIVKAFQQGEDRIRYRRSASNMGVVNSRNLALDTARGEYVAFLDADDVWETFKLDRQVAFMEETGVAISYGDYVRMDGDGRELGKVLAPEVVRYERLLRSNFIGNLTGIFRRVDLAGLRFEDSKHEDYLFWLRALGQVEVARATPSSEPLARYRVSSSSMSANKFHAARWQWAIYRSRLGLSAFRSSFLFLCYMWHAILKRSISRKANR